MCSHPRLCIFSSPVVVKLLILFLIGFKRKGENAQAKRPKRRKQEWLL